MENEGKNVFSSVNGLLIEFFQFMTSASHLSALKAYQ
jgi:hypothetical protein